MNISLYIFLHVNYNSYVPKEQFRGYPILIFGILNNNIFSEHRIFLCELHLLTHCLHCSSSIQLTNP